MIKWAGDCGGAWSLIGGPSKNSLEWCKMALQFYDRDWKNMALDYIHLVQHGAGQ